MKLKIHFICTTCQYRNRLETGTDGYEQRQTEFDSLTDAWRHLFETHEGYSEGIHEMEAIADEEDNG